MDDILYIIVTRYLPCNIFQTTLVCRAWAQWQQIRAATAVRILQIFWRRHRIHEDLYPDFDTSTKHTLVRMYVTRYPEEFMATYHRFAAQKLRRMEYLDGFGPVLRTRREFRTFLQRLSRREIEVVGW
jgi:hypothetical protein